MEAHQTSNLGVLGSSPRQDVRKIFLNFKSKNLLEVFLLF